MYQSDKETWEQHGLTFKFWRQSDDDCSQYFDELGSPCSRYRDLEEPYYDRHEDILVVRTYMLALTPEQDKRFRRINDLAERAAGRRITQAMRGWVDRLMAEHAKLKEIDNGNIHAREIYDGGQFWVETFDVDDVAADRYREARWIHKGQVDINKELEWLGADKIAEFVAAGKNPRETMCEVALKQFKRLDDLFDGHWWYTSCHVSIELDDEEVSCAAVYGVESDSDDSYIEELKKDLIEEALHDAKDVPDVLKTKSVTLVEDAAKIKAALDHYNANVLSHAYSEGVSPGAGPEAAVESDQRV